MSEGLKCPLLLSFVFELQMADVNNEPHNQQPLGRKKNYVKVLGYLF